MIISVNINMNNKTRLRSHWHCVYNLKYHLVLVTKYRKKVLSGIVLQNLSEKMHELCAKWDVDIIEFGGEEDHVHLLLDMHPSVQLSKFVNNIKTVSSRHINKIHNAHLKKFYWNKNVLWTRAYCLITAGGAPITILRQYIEKQGEK